MAGRMPTEPSMDSNQHRVVDPVLILVLVLEQVVESGERVRFVALSK